MTVQGVGLQVFVSGAEVDTVDRLKSILHHTTTVMVCRLLLKTDIHKRTTVEPAYTEFATQESPFINQFSCSKASRAKNKLINSLMLNNLITPTELFFIME